jgi:hypothetical protein
MSQDNPELCSLINDSCSNEFFCGTCPIAREKLFAIDEFKNIKNIQFSSFSQTNRIAILFTTTTNPQNNPENLLLGYVRKGHYQKLITRTELSRLKKSQ